MQQRSYVCFIYVSNNFQYERPHVTSAQSLEIYK